MTCLADCAAMRPYSSGGRVSAMVSPICAPGLARRASSNEIWFDEFSTCSTPSMWRDSRNSPFLASISAGTSVSLPYLARAALAMASSIAAITMPRSMDFSRATASAICSSSSLLALTAAMASVSFGGIDFASSQSFCGEAVFLGIQRGILLVRLRFRLVALRRIALFRIRRRWCLALEIPANLTFSRLAPPHRFRDQIIGQNQPGLGDIFHDQQNITVFAAARLIAM